MPELADITYSQRAAISAVTKYYKFLTKMYLLDSQVIYPPAGGWPSIVNADAATLGSLGKSDEVLSLLAHLPYIRSPGTWNDDAEAIPGCAFTAEDVRTTTEGGAFTAVAPSHVVGLTCGGRENPVLILDTKYGIIHWEDCPSSVEHGYYSTTVDYDPPEGEDSDEDDERDESAREEELAWRQSAPAWTIPDFFENLKD